MSKRGCKVCPKTMTPGSSRSRSQGPPPPPTRPRSRGPCCGGTCPSERRAKPSLPPQYFPTTPGETPQWPQMRRSFPREVRQFQYNENFFDPNRPGMQSRHLVTGLSNSMSLQRRSQPRMSVQQPIAEHPPTSIPRLRPGTTPCGPSRPAPPSGPSGIPQRAPTPRPTPRSAPRPLRPSGGAIRRVPGVAMRVPVRTPETPPVQRSRQSRRRPPSAPAPQQAASPCHRGRPPQYPLDSSLEEFETLERMFQQEESLGVRDRSRDPSAARPGYEDDSLGEFENLEDVCKRAALEDLRADNVQVLGVQPTGATQIPRAAPLNVIPLSQSMPSQPAPAERGPTPLRQALTRQWQRAQANWSPETMLSSPERPWPPTNVMDEGFIQDETIDFPPSPGLDTGFIEDDSMTFPLGYDELNCGFIEDESMEFPPSPGLDDAFIEDESYGYGMGGYPGSPFDDTPMNMTSSCDPNCTGSPNRRG